MQLGKVAALLMLLIALPALAQPIVRPPDSFREAKALAEGMYADRRVDAYCGCAFSVDKRVDFQSCDYRPRKNLDRGLRIEWEHVVSASKIAQDGACWARGGREHCRETDPWFRADGPAQPRPGGGRAQCRPQQLPSGHRPRRGQSLRRLRL